MIHRKGVRDIEIHNNNTQQLKAQVDAILKIIHTLESKGLHMTDEQIANIARVTPEQVKYVRSSFQQKEVTVPSANIMKDMIEDMKKDILATLKDEVAKLTPATTVERIVEKVVSKDEVVKDEPIKVDTPRPTIKSSVADVFNYKEGNADIKMGEGATQVESVSNQLDMLKNLRLGKK